MIYKKYEFSLSLNGDEIVHIARNAAGNVIFRESSEKSLKQAIDGAEQLIQETAEQEEKRRKEAENKKKKKGLFQPEEPETVVETEEVEEEVKVEEESVLVPTTLPQARVTRGPDGKFISASALAGSKRQLDSTEPQKKGFWEKITS
jgi:hypothetical protein